MSTHIPSSDFNKNIFLSRVLELHQVPKQLYCKGELPTFTQDEYGSITPRILTVVGSRKYTNYGKDALETLLSSLSGYPVIILSGLALGIDSLAHKAALKHNLKTIAIPGSGLGKQSLYPRTNYMLAQEILTQNGLLLSELDDHQSAAPWTFPARNRLMAALSDAVLIIEAEEKSGTLITARQALELGKDIGVVPGSIFSPSSAGTNSLLKDGAYPITNQEDLLSLLKLSPKGEAVNPQKTLPLLSQIEKEIFDALTEPTTKEELQARTNCTTAEFLIAFSKLELSGLINESLGEVRRIV